MLVLVSLLLISMGQLRLVDAAAGVSPPPNQDPNCFSCASPVLRQNWEVTGLPKTPTDPKYFSYSNCDSQPSQATGQCYSPSGVCYFSMHTLDTGEYVSVRGCIEQLLGPGDHTPGEDVCEIARSNVRISIGGFSGRPFVGWETCRTTDCNNKVVGVPLARTEWKPAGDPPGNACIEPKQINCIDCEHVDGRGSCKHDTKTYCAGNYCTKTTGKLGGRWFEIRGCTPINPLYATTCIDYEKELYIPQVGGSINQSYVATTCTCREDRCNSAVRALDTMLVVRLVGLVAALMLAVTQL